MTIRLKAWVLSASLLLIAGGLLYAQDAPPPPADKYVPREDFDKLLKSFQELQAEVKTLKQGQVAPAVSADDTAKQRQAAQDTQDRLQALDDSMRQVRALAEAGAPGDFKFLITGDAGVGFSAVRQSKNSFDAGVSPLILWEVNQRILVEAGFDFGLNSDGSTATELSIATISYLANDWLTVGGGLFVVPFGIYHGHTDPRWINKLPDDPLVFSDGGLAPGSQLGAFATGAHPIFGNQQINYALYVANGPTLVTADPAAAGSLDFSNNLPDTKDAKAVGGRLGWRPIPELEFGYSFQVGQVNPDGFATWALLQALDVNYVKEIERLAGQLTLRAEWVFSNVDGATYDPTGGMGFGPLSFNNDRTGGYVLVAYRPSRVENKILKNLEFVFRYDRLDIPSAAPGGGHHQRFTPGIDFWITPVTVFKVAYEFDDQDGPNQSGIMLQLATSF